MVLVNVVKIDRQIAENLNATDTCRQFHLLMPKTNRINWNSAFFWSLIENPRGRNFDEWWSESFHFIIFILMRLLWTNRACRVDSKWCHRESQARVKSDTESLSWLFLIWMWITFEVLHRFRSIDFFSNESGESVFRIFFFCKLLFCLLQMDWKIVKKAFHGMTYIDQSSKWNKMAKLCYLLTVIYSMNFCLSRSYLDSSL